RFIKTLSSGTACANIGTLSAKWRAASLIIQVFPHGKHTSPRAILTRMRFRSDGGATKMATSFVKLTRTAIRKLPRRQRVTERGVTFERLANGDGLFTVNIMVDRRRIHRTIGRESEGVTRCAAEQFIAKARHEAREGRLNLPKRRKIALTLSAAVPLYI